MAGAAIQDSDYKCSLSADVEDKAKKELKEDPSTRLVEVKNLRTRVGKIPGLKTRTDLPFLLSFLRARKFDQERSYQLVKNHYEVRKDIEFFGDLKPSRIKHVIEDGVVEILEHPDNNGCRVMVLRPARWDPDRYPMTDMPKAFYLLLCYLARDEEAQVHGVHVINNLSDLTWKHASNINPSFAKKTLHILQDVVPLRLKRLDYVNEPTFFDIIFSIMKQFMKEKLVKRIHFNGEKRDMLHASISPDFLPTDLGGKLAPYSNKKFMDAFLASDSSFEEDNKFGFLNMSLDKDQKEKKNADAGMAGLGGMFRKLDI
ncbi:alpha-tocopherol transfer protein-like [Aplysia californica]|uniref:Alpha-tocopherol transfer protein-like n=1 Tax=Aplysia californica TaxID=6500 RepID=A0ABM1ADP8_APLCA|nr:alpha-tocopherol transfer protein-like [Aplysia californica]XP_012945713.1 alpha-tocopherol transfer protein-like [Aplysia californica]XP_012945714.1 alpha-tocopherol transfer protein-like [Aplysia californica]XP_012945715.1 alpha-tocopherol transfer protein-like [Aplysia californica]